jgi:hypothetical protein
MTEETSGPPAPHGVESSRFGWFAFRPEGAQDLDDEDPVIHHVKLREHEYAGPFWNHEGHLSDGGEQRGHLYVGGRGLSRSARVAADSRRRLPSGRALTRAEALRAHHPESRRFPQSACHASGLGFSHSARTKACTESAVHDTDWRPPERPWNGCPVPVGETRWAAPRPISESPRSPLGSRDPKGRPQGERSSGTRRSSGAGARDHSASPVERRCHDSVPAQGNPRPGIARVGYLWIVFRA